MTEVVSELTQGSVGDAGGAHEDVAVSGKIWHAGRKHPAVLGTCQRVSTKREGWQSLKSRIYFGFHFSKVPGPFSSSSSWLLHTPSVIPSATAIAEVCSR